MQKPSRFNLLMIALCSYFISGCAHSPTVNKVAEVDLSRFMGAWYVIACIPTFIEKEAYNAVESYKMNQDGTISTTFTYNKGSLDGPVKTFNPKGYVVKDTGNGLWGMQFIWPFRSEFVVSYIDQDYSTTVIARSARDYVWIMARSPDMSEARYEELKQYVSQLGYDVKLLRRIPHHSVSKPAETGANN